MKAYLVVIVILTAIMILFPFISLRNLNPTKNSSDQQQNTSEIISTSLTTQAETKPETVDKIQVISASSGKIIEVEMYDFLLGTLSAEMPASYETEALKAQCVVLYSYAKWIKKNSDSGKLTSAQKTVAAEISGCYLNDDELKEKWGKLYDNYIEKIKDVINSVLGEYLIYENEPILAPYHELSVGKTESAKNVWGNDIPYLQSVTANGDKLSPDYNSTVKIKADELKIKAEKIDDVSLSDIEKDKWISKPGATKTGYVKSLKIGEKTVSGRDLAIILSLKSPYFTCKYSNDTFVFSVKGIGDGVGMSQYSADYMARQGADYKEILSHFYSGTEIVKD